MPSTMLEHQMILLEKTSSDKDLFRKELLKSFRWLESYEIIKLHSWLKQNYYNTHREVIKDVFGYFAA